MADIAEPSSSANRTNLQPRITVKSEACHHLDTCRNPGCLKIRFKVWKSYSTEEWLGFHRKTFSATLWFPLSVLADPVKTFPDFWKTFTSAKLADEDNLWEQIVSSVFDHANNLHVRGTRQLISVAVKIEVPTGERDVLELRQFKVSDECSLDGECSICCAELSPGEELTETERCLHVFHSSCLRQWLRDKDSCPMCRRVLISSL